LTQIEADLPDIVLTDLQMPEMNGLELVTAIKDRFPSVPVILMTAQGSEEIASQALRQGAASYVPKRRLAEDLVPTVERVLARSREEHKHSLLMHHLISTNTRFEFSNDPDLLKGIVDHLLDVIRCIPLGDETERLRVGIALEEALSNAYYHGNLEVTGIGSRRDRKRYEELARIRSTEQPYCLRKIHVHAIVSPWEAKFVIRDEGPGFHTSQWNQGEGVSNHEPGFGRGIVLMRSVMDEVIYNEIGNEVTLIKRALPISESEVD
jgi:anti-sigma regulatory factor (Ser/Thr protein kinase)